MWTPIPTQLPAPSSLMFKIGRKLSLISYPTFKIRYDNRNHTPYESTTGHNCGIFASIHKYSHQFSNFFKLNKLLFLVSADSKSQTQQILQEEPETASYQRKIRDFMFLLFQILKKCSLKVPSVVIDNMLTASAKLQMLD